MAPETPRFTVWVDPTGHDAHRVNLAVDSVRIQTADIDNIVVLGEDEPVEALSAHLAAARGSHVVWLDASSDLTDNALRDAAKALVRFPSDLLYGDTALAVAGGGAIRRPVYSPIRLSEQDYLGDVRIFACAAVREMGGFLPEAGESHRWNITRRVSHHRGSVLHVPSLLTTRQLPSTAVALVTPQAVLRLDSAPLVSIIIPTRGSSASIRGVESVLVVDAVRSIIEKSTYPAFEIVVVADSATPPSVRDELERIGGDRIRIIEWTAEFDFSAKINRGAAHARGDYLLPLNDDIEIITPDWIEVMLGLAQQPGVGVVGTMLFFEDGSIQHGGHLYRDGGAGHIAFRWPADRDDALGSLHVDREVSGVTAACLLVSRSTFQRVGGFSTLFPGNYNDVDFCLKVRGLGLSAIWTPRAQLFHFESKTRVATIHPSEIALLNQRWGSRIQVDPYWP